MTSIQWQQGSSSHQASDVHAVRDTGGSSAIPTNVWFGMSMLLMGVLAGMGLGVFLLTR